MVDFNPRSPHGERQTSMPAPSYMSAFQPTLPARGATCCRISHTSTRQPFQPTLPARGATDTTFSGVCPTSFQPTLPARGATRMRHATPRRAAISTHAPRTGSDAAEAALRAVRAAFQPTLPARGATEDCSSSSLPSIKFQPTLPARGATSPSPPYIYR